MVKKGETVLKTLTNGGGTFAINDAAIFPLGTHTLTAHYEGDGNYLPSVSSPRTITIKKPTPVMTLSLSGLSPYTYNQQVTMTAAFPNHSDVTGSVTFLCFGQTLGSATISNAQAVLSAPMPWGDGTCMATYAGDAKYGASSGFSYATSHYAKMATPPIVVATAISPYEVVVSISPIAGATHYDIYRSIDGSPLVHINSTHTTINHHPPSGTKVVVFAAAAKNTTTGAITSAGPRDFASMVQFSSSAAASTLIKATDVSELQSAVNALRVATGLAATTFSPPAGLISAAHLNSLRTAITQARSAFGMATSFSDPTITPGTTKVRAVHWQQLREGLK